MFRGHFRSWERPAVEVWTRYGAIEVMKRQFEAPLFLVQALECAVGCSLP